MSGLEALDILLDLTRTLTEQRSLEEALGAVTDAALRLLPCDHASIRLLDDSGRLLAGARSGEGTDHAPQAFRSGEGVSGWVAREGVPVRIDDAHADDRFVARQDSFRIGSLLAAPLSSAGRVIGVLSVSSPERGAFGDRDLDIARLLANTTVPPIEHARLERLSITDDHTATFNQRYLRPRLEEEMRRAALGGSALSVLMMDLDHFKRVNDTHGHPVGDVVLSIFAERAKKSVRRRDVLVRRGGEEFVLIMPMTGTEDARLVAERVRNAMDDDDVVVGDVRLHQTVSIGVATWDGEEDADRLDERSDEAMYRAKQAGRNRVVVHPADAGDEATAR